MKFILNIGLESQATSLISAHVAREIVSANEFLVTNYSVGESDTEPTLVCEVMPLKTDLRQIAQDVYQIAVDLRQDCVAVYVPLTGKGVLMGPRAERWGPFNPARFVTLDGQRLSKEQACRPSND